MELFLVTLGSRGDVHPLLALGRALHARGHFATMLTNPAFESEVRRAGLGYVPIGAAQDYHDTVAHPKLWHPVDGLGVMWRYLLRPALRPTFEALRALAGGGRALVLANPMAMGARVAQEATGIRLVSTYTAATLLRSVHDPLTMAQWRVPGWVPQVARGLLWKALDRVKLDPLILPALESLRSDNGLPPLRAAGRSVFGDWLHSPMAGLTLFPPWFAPTPPDWPATLQEGRFPLHDDPLDSDAPDADAAGLERFLAAGDAPVVFMPGSAQQGTGPFFASALDACARLGLRGVLLGHGGATAAGPLPATVWAAPYAPFGTLLPRARAIVHHGGIGTCAQGLRAGIPQLVWPQAFDQFDNAMRLELLGVGLRLRAHPVDAPEMAAQLGRLLDNLAVTQACQRRASQLAGEDLQPACAWLEGLP